MNDVFVSYSRRDKEFTLKLVGALKAANRELWADWEDIPPGSDWFAEIKEGIEKSQTVLFILSPEWVKSGECAKELAYAVQMGKRLIPVVWQNVDPKGVPPELAKINWIFMRETDDFDNGFQLVIKTMDTDLDWVKSHTRIQVRALEWDTRKRDHSFILRGKDLDDAEKFLSTGSHKDPEPTSLQGEYILISRKEAIRLQRMILGGVIAALIISVFLGILAAFQWQAARRAEATAVVERDHAVIAENTAVAAQSTAVAERDRADLNATIGFSRELASQAITNLDVDPERSLLLALQSIEITNSVRQPILPVAEDAIRRAVQTSRVRLTLAGDDTNDMMAVAFSRDGQRLATANWGGVVMVWDISNPNQPLLTFSDPSSPFLSVAFSPDGNLIATGSDDGTVAIWDADSGTKTKTLSGHTAAVNKVAFSPDGTNLVTASSDKTAKVWNVNTGEEVLTLDHPADVTSAVFSPGLGDYIATSAYDGLIRVWDAHTGAESFTLTEGCPELVDVAISPDGNYIATGDRCDQVVVFELASSLVPPSDTSISTPHSSSARIEPSNVSNASSSILFTLTDHTDTISAVAFSPDGTMLATASRDDSVIVVDAHKGSTKYSLSSSAGDVLATAFSPDGNYIATAHPAGVAKLWNASPFAGVEMGEILAHHGPVNSLAFSPDGTRLASAGDDQMAYIWPLTQGNSVSLTGHGNGVTSVVFSSDGNKVVTGSWDGTAILWDATTGTQEQTFSKDGAGVLGVAISADGQTIAGGLDHTQSVAVLWDVATGQEKLSMPFTLGYWVNKVVFSPDGSRVAAASDDYSAGVWDIASGNQLFMLQHNDWVKAVAFSPDGKQVLTGSYDKKAILWDANTGEQIRAFIGHAAGINGVAFSPDGALVATASADGTTKVWDASSGTLFFTLYTGGGPVNAVAFSPDGTVLATGSKDGVVRFYYLHIEDAIALARTRITRSLTEQECKTYLHQVACPDTLVKPGGSVSLQPALTPQPATTTTTAHAIRSGDGTTPVTMNLTNNSSETLELFWVDFDGIEEPYGEIAPGTTFVQETYSTHAWRVLDSAGNIVLEYVMTEQSTQNVEINADKTVVTPTP